MHKVHNSNFLITSLVWWRRVDYCNSVVREHEFVKNKETFHDFLIFFNIALKPSHQQAMIMFETIVDQQKVFFFQRYERGLVHRRLANDHHLNMPTRFEIDDDFIGHKYILINGILTVMNEQMKYLPIGGPIQPTTKNEDHWHKSYIKEL